MSKDASRPNPSDKVRDADAEQRRTVAAAESQKRIDEAEARRLAAKAKKAAGKKKGK